MFLLFSTDLKFGKTSPSVYNANRIRPRWPPWPHLTGCPALGVNPGWKIGYQSFMFQPFAALLELCSFSSFHRTRRHQDQPRPGSPCTTPAGSGRGVHSDHTWQADQPWESILDERSGIKVLYFNHLLHFLHSAVCPLSTDPKDSRINHTRLSLVQRRADPAENWSWDRTPPPIEAGKRPLVQGFVNKNSVKTPYPMEVVRLLEYHQSKMPLLSGT